MNTVVVIGGGASGMMAAIAASNKNKVILIDKNEKLGKKLYITGKGRCNVTSSKDLEDFFENIPTNSNFLYSSLYTFTNEDLISFFEKRGVKLKVERGDRVFPESNKSSDIIKVLKNELIKNNVEIMLNSCVKKFIIDKNKIIGIVLDNNKTIYGEYFILCTGGLSYPKTGSTGDGYKFAKMMGHNIIKPSPSLVPIEIKENWISAKLQGLSLKNVEFSIIDENNKILYTKFGEMLFTHYGLSGPIVLSGSGVLNNKNNCKAVINLKPALTKKELDKRIQRDFEKFSNKDFKNSLDELLPKKIIDVIVKLSQIDENKKVNLITKEERNSLVNLLQNFTLNIKGLRSIDEAIITSGGIDVKEVDSSTMKSKIISNLQFAGELLDVDAYTGGFNLQIAFSTAYLAGIKVLE